MHLLGDVELYDGAPVGLQIIGRRLEEEHVLAVAAEVVDALAAAATDQGRGKTASL